jgi:phosphoribosylformimino-5-aminoimidazole carboxamide ribotide isomerase
LRERDGVRVNMDIIPAIDIRGGRCVRLYQGDYAKETVFSDDPVAVALRWQRQGARWLHLVDLDGAAKGEVVNFPTIANIVRGVDIAAEVGGGIRDEDTVSRLLNLGVKRVILGTVAVEKPEMVAELCQKFGEAIAVGIDARDGYVAKRGWLEDTDIDALVLARKMASLGVSRIIYTDIKRDGTLTEPDFEAIGRMVKGVNIPVIAAGGISRLEHLERLKELGVAGAIIGRALYTGDIDLRQALKLQD